MSVRQSASQPVSNKKDNPDKEKQGVKVMMEVKCGFGCKVMTLHISAYRRNLAKGGGVRMKYNQGLVKVLRIRQRMKRTKQDRI